MAAVVVSATLALGGCEGCLGCLTCQSCMGCESWYSCRSCLSCIGCEGAAEMVPAELNRYPPDESVADLVKRRLLEAADIATKTCGVQVDGLDATKVERVDAPRVWGWGRVRVQGTPIDYAAEAAPEAVAGSPGPVKVDSRSRLLVCTAVLTYVVTGTVQPDESVRWEIVSLELHEVETPGVRFVRPRSGGDFDWD